MVNKFVTYRLRRLGRGYWSWQRRGVICDTRRSEARHSARLAALKELH